jgi:hypothetical protein
MVGGRGSDTCRCDRFYRVVSQINQPDIVLIEDLVIPLLERGSLGAEGMGGFSRRELLRDRWVFDAREDLGPPEIIRQPVGFQVA